MNKESKILMVALAVLLVTSPLIVGAMATEDESNPSYKVRQWIMLRLQQIRLRIAWFFKGAENAMVTGTVTARSNNILIVTDSSGNRINIVLPWRWNINQQIVLLNDIDQYLTGEVTVKTLSRTATNEKGVTVTMLIAYEITADGKTLYAVLPYNIRS